MFLLRGAPKGWEITNSMSKSEKNEIMLLFQYFLIKCNEMGLLRVFEGLGPDMGSRTYEKGQELLLFLHAGGNAPVLGEISENQEFHRISGKSQNSIGIQKISIKYCFPVKSTPSRNLVFP